MARLLCLCRLALLTSLLTSMLTLLLLPARAASPDLLLEVRIGQHVLSDAIGAYQQGDDVLLPLGELARMLTIAIRVDPANGNASGYIVDEERRFRLDLASKTVLRAALSEAFDSAQVRPLADDTYVASGLLARWLPVDFELDMAGLALQVRPREKLPLQARLERQRSGLPGAGSALPLDPGYPRLVTPYALAGMPFADQTVGLDLRRSAAHKSTYTSYTGYFTGDLLGAEAALYLNTATDANGPAARLSIGRHDPDGALLGPLKARTVQAGSVSAPGAPEIALSSARGNGVFISNRPLGQPMRTDRHSLQGDLPPGWDVELYFNDALVGIMQSRADGRYAFDDQPLLYGPNEFKLVFHGPLGQVRIERHSFLIEQSMLAPGQMFYSLAAQRGDDGRRRAAARLDWGIGQHLSASAGLLRLPVGQAERSFAELGVQGYLDKFMLQLALVRADDGGTLSKAGLRTRLGPWSVAASRAYARGYTSDYYHVAADPVRVRDELRADAVVAAMPLSVQARRELLASGAHNVELAARISAYRFGAALSNSLRWQSQAGHEIADGVLQASRRVAGVGFSGQLQYAIRPQTKVQTLALSLDKHFSDAYLASAGVARTFVDPHTRFTLALNKGMGSFGMGINGYYSSRGDYGLGLQLFLALAQDRPRGRWLTEAAPIAASGAASLRVFVDRNGNALMDAGDEPVAGAGFVVNGVSRIERTGVDGLAWLGRLAPNQHTDIGIDASTLEDPQWLAQRKGVRIVTRPGKVSEVDFAVAVTGEIDGTVYALAGGRKRAAGDVALELVDAAGRLVGAASSGADGYFVLAGVLPGAYQLRVAPAQLARLGMRAPPGYLINMDRDGTLVNGKDFVLDAVTMAQAK